MPEPLVLIGAGGHAEACIDIVEMDGGYEIVGLLGQAHEAGRHVLGYPILGTDDDLLACRERARWALVCVGQIKSPNSRMHLFQLASRAGFEMASVISPLAHVSRHATIEDGTVVMHGAVVNAGALVGRNCIVNSCALIEHGSAVADHCHIATSATLNSGVRVGEGTFIGSGATVRQGTVIGKRCVIGMAQSVLADCVDGTWLPQRAVEAH